jgi:hypothetical protein
MSQEFADVTMNPAVSSADSLMNVIKLRENVVSTIVSEFVRIDINNTICNMEIIGNLFLAAYACSIGYSNCNGLVLRILRAYLRLVKDARLLHGRFVKASLDALGCIRTAATFYDYYPTQFDAAVKLLPDNAIAFQFVERARAIASSCTDICKLSEEALFVSCSNAIEQNKLFAQLVHRTSVSDMPPYLKMAMELDGGSELKAKAKMRMDNTPSRSEISAVWKSLSAMMFCMIGPCGVLSARTVVRDQVSEMEDDYLVQTMKALSACVDALKAVKEVFMNVEAYWKDFKVIRSLLDDVYCCTD